MGHTVELAGVLNGSDRFISETRAAKKSAFAMTSVNTIDKTELKLRVTTGLSPKNRDFINLLAFAQILHVESISNAFRGLIHADNRPFKNQISSLEALALRKG